METAGPILEMLPIPKGVPIIIRDMVAHAKPDPDLFLAAVERLGKGGGNAIVVGDSVWDLLAARRAKLLGIGVLSGDYGDDELTRVGAYRVYDDPAMLAVLDRVAALSGRWPKLPPSESKAIVQQLVQRVEVSRDLLQIDVRRVALLSGPSAAG
jgi:hypothetical protein